ncbi:E3 ubiquitin-protein ligase RNF168 [Habropoda laboriosa]|uniref:RING-type E3 ubiquitin transferase n=1 Tax=Habropoda laboriosa TaxID=597456 RepID=A0A0L7RJ35_9HYME|nr:E3 ubiquitin-protein ligase RNF168 [Habropoda laboriosa]
MATYLKRTSKLFDISLTQSSVDLSLRDLICPVCRSILIEPVTLPCTHNLCLKCLKGTFEHNSLSCPLCRVRVGSWLRTATKTETLVNSGLWELIQTKFSKEVENKYNGDDKNIELDADFAGANKILSAAGEIRREYEVQLQMAKEEMRCQRKAEQIASEALIRKIQEEEQQQQLAQLTQDQFFAKSIMKKQIVEKQEDTSKYNNSFNASNSSFHTSKFNVATMTEVNSCKVEPHSSKYEKSALLQPYEGSGLRRSNIALISKIRAERHASSAKNSADLSNAYNDSASKFCCQNPMPVYNAISRTLKHQTSTKVIEPCVSNCSLEPRMSSSKIYGTQSKEELRIPNDIVNSKKKSLGVEVCISSGDDDERTGSAESAGSHDSINQEIHHFKPIKAMPRTPLKISTDGRQIDPKLIRVVPVLKRISNVVPKPPSQTHLKRIIGCSWSAFRGKTKQSSKEKEVCKEEIEQRPSTSCNQSQIISSKVTKFQAHDSIRKLDFVSEVPFNSNKNYAKNANKIINGTKINKKLILEEHRDIRKVQKSWKSHIRNGMICKSKQQRTLWTKKDIKTVTNAKYVNDIEMRNLTSSSMSIKVNSPCGEESEVQEEDEITTENIAERIKKRKINTDKRNSNRVSPLNIDLETITKRSTRKRVCRQEDLDYKMTDEVPVAVQKKKSCEQSDVSIRLNCQISNSGLRKTTRKIRYTNSSINSEPDVTYEKQDGNNYNSSKSCNEMQECISSENNNATGTSTIVEKNVLSDEEIIKEQERMERLVIQEKEDFELARRLQAKFDEMERIAGRTRRSKKAIESETIELDLYKIDAGRNVQKAMNMHTAKSSILNHTINTEAKKRGRPPKRVK